MARKTKGGMMRTISKLLTTAGITLGKSIGKDYLQKKSMKVATGVYDDPSLATNPQFLLTAKKSVKKPTTNMYHNIDDKENANQNLAGKSRKNKKSRKNIKRKKTRKNRK